MNKKKATDVLLKESFKKLVLTRPIEKITIKEITDEAGVIRPTFYNHFQDKFELLEQIILTDLLEPIRPLIENRMIDEALRILFASIQKEQDFYVHAVRWEGNANSFETISRKCVEEILLEIIHKNALRKIQTMNWLTPEHVAEYYSHMICSIVIIWVKSGMSVSPEELLEIYNYLVRNTISHVLFGEED